MNKKEQAARRANVKASVSVGGRPTKGDVRSLHNWVGKLSVTATSEGDQYILAAINRILFGGKLPECEEARDMLIKLAEKCRDDHFAAMDKKSAQ